MRYVNPRGEAVAEVTELLDITNPARHEPGRPLARAAPLPRLLRCVDMPATPRSTSDVAYSLNRHE